MLIHKVTCSNFMALGDCELELPEAGVTVLTGPNGAGKSRLIEAVAYAFWGKTLRDEDPWIEGQAGSVSVLTSVGDATRKITKGGTKTLYWNGQKADTNSRTQELIAAAVPEFDFWRRTHVFSSGEAAHFSGATDGERKRIMEMLLGMEVFDRAQRACLDSVGQANAAVQAAQLEVANAKGAHAVAVARLLGEYPAFRAGVPPVVPEFDPLCLRKAERLDQDIAGLEHARRAAQQATARLPSTELAQPIADLRAKVRDADARLELARAGNCSKCGQEWHGESLEELEQIAGDLVWELQALEEEQRTAGDVVRKAVELARLDVRRLDGELATKRSERQKLEAADASHLQASLALERFEEAETAALANWAISRDAHEAERAARRNRAMDLEDELADLQSYLEGAQTKALELQVTSVILGVKGLRGHVLGRALDGVEAVANYWLQQIAPGRALTVRSEGDAGKIAIKIHGFGGGSYRASSAGERRRIDAPLLLALAEVAGHGRSRGTLFLDEVFDALDRDGRALVCRALGELGQTQSVVLITHSEDVAMQVNAVQRLSVESGFLRAL